MQQDSFVTVFERTHPKLKGLAYRMLGSFAEAEDAVQDSFLQWQQADREAVQNPEAWLTSVCTRKCIDMLRAARNSRVAYIGPWLPEPVHTESNDNPEEQAMLVSSLTTAFLLLLERLSPKERAAYLLYEIFDESYTEVAKTLGMQEPACRKLVSRARERIGQVEKRYLPPEKATQQKLLHAFQQAITSGDTATLAEMLAEQAEISADSNGKAPAIRGVLVGRDKVLRFIRRVLLPACRNERQVVTEINGGLGLRIYEGGKLASIFSFAYDEKGHVTAIYIMRNPDKLGEVAVKRMR